MNVIHIESGLGNQMLSYCEYLAMKHMNPGVDTYIETACYSIPECNDVFFQWNGYELENVFNIKAPNIKDVLDEKDWDEFIRSLRKSQFWLKNWNYPRYFPQAFERIGFHLTSVHDDFESPEYVRRNDVSSFSPLKRWIKGLYLYETLKSYRQMVFGQRRRMSQNYTRRLFFESADNLFAGQQLLFKFYGSGIETIEKEIRKSFVFPVINDSRNLSVLDAIEGSNSVALHIRRGDLLGLNRPCYEHGYFRRAVKYIRRHVDRPVFFVFSDPGSIEWIVQNDKILGLNSGLDKIHYITWNKGNESYRDMQLMARCKHQIITHSTFGWWGAWLNENPDKITISPDYRYNTKLFM